MLTLTEYGHLWKTHFSGIVPAGVIMPDYCEYLNREIYQQDYLDLFGAIVAETFPRVMIGANWYVEITRHPILSTLGLTLLHRPYIYHHTDGNDYLLVDYDFPYKGQLNKGRCIKYIMIGEAARPDSAGTYFYNINHTNRTDYFSAPCNAFSVVKGSKRDKLIDLAINGVVLLDIFPFALDYTPLRKKLSTFAINRFDSIILRLNAMCDLVCKENNKFTFLCSPSHAIAIIQNYPAVTICKKIIPLNELSNLNWSTWSTGLVINPLPILGTSIGDWHSISHKAVAVSGTILNIGKRRIHKYRVMGKTGTYNYPPNEIVIRFSFDL